MKRENIQRSRALRRNQTNAEKKLWDLLGNRQLLDVKFRRQFPIGHYIIDFYSPQCRLGIEADGGQHYHEDGKRKDRIRTEELSKFGIKILRFSDCEVLNNIEGTLEVIQQEIGKPMIPPHLNPLPRGERRGVVG
jgi:adenine-specific DNA-methyltransferase